MTVPRRTLKLDGEHIIDSGYTLPLHWRISEGREWGAGHTAYIAFHLRKDLETDAEFTIKEAVAACWELERKHAQ
jgi:hypothetical protein